MASTGFHRNQTIIDDVHVHGDRIHAYDMYLGNGTSLKVCYVVVKLNNVSAVIFFVSHHKRIA